MAHCCESRAASVTLSATPPTPPHPSATNTRYAALERPGAPHTATEPATLRPTSSGGAVYYYLLPHAASASRSLSPLSGELVEQRRLDGTPAAPRFYGGARCRGLGRRRQTCRERLERHSKVIDDAPARSA